ncbi:MAG: hypothetical protein PUG56_00740 [Ruminococcus sp.]|nr:hypothetical protein [Ruminococcus sp.]
MKITSKITAVVLSAVMLLPLAQPLSFAAEKASNCSVQLNS